MNRITVWRPLQETSSRERLFYKIMTFIALVALGATMRAVDVPWLGIFAHQFSMVVFMNIWYSVGRRKSPTPEYVFDSPEGLEAFARVLRESGERHDDA